MAKNIEGVAVLADELGANVGVANLIRHGNLLSRSVQKFGPASHHAYDPIYRNFAAMMFAWVS
jgi:hypothetical protein